MYGWDSEVLGQYGKGTILVLAESVGQAREKAYEAFLGYLQREHFYRFREDGSTDEDEAVWLTDQYYALERDLAAKPEVLGVAFIQGSE